MKKKPAIFHSTSTQHGRQIVRTAIHIPSVMEMDWGMGKDLKTAWEKCKSDLGYATYDDVSKAMGTDVSYIASHLKWIWKQNPLSVSFNIDRMGANVCFRLNFPKISS